MANGKQSESRAADIIKNWIRTRYTIEFLGPWEMIHNPNIKVVEFDHFRIRNSGTIPNDLLCKTTFVNDCLIHSLYSMDFVNYLRNVRISLVWKQMGYVYVTDLFVFSPYFL